MEMTMSMTTKANAELELRPLHVRELDIVSGGGIPVQQPFFRDGRAAGYGRFQLDLYFAWYVDAPVNSPVKLLNYGNIGRLG
jgi:hypothetical protein